MVKVSICIPTYNNAACLAQLLDSIMEQTYKDYEVIITDDSTNNEIEQLLERYNCRKIRYVHNKVRLGHIFNWNAAIALAKGDYIKIMFSDDWFTFKDSLLEYVKLLDENLDADFAFSGSMQVSDEETYVRKIQAEFAARLRKDYRNIFLGNQIGAPSGTIYRNNGIMFDEKSNWASDLVLYLDMLSHNAQFAYSEKPLVSIGLHGEQYTHMFAERDDRIFNDYYYMYLKHSLKDSAECKRFFMDEYIMKFAKGLKIAQNCGFSTREYVWTRIAYLWRNKVVDYANAAIKRIREGNLNFKS